jgi:hypothetical protein
MAIEPAGLLGYWCESSPAQYLGFPDPAALVAPDWERKRRADIVSYLRAGTPQAQYMGYSTCRFADCTHRDRSCLGSADLTDGQWIWPEGLWHYVHDHAVRLPDEFVASAAKRKFVIPAKLDARARVFADPVQNRPSAWRNSTSRRHRSRSRDGRRSSRATGRSRWCPRWTRSCGAGPWNAGGERSSILLPATGARRAAAWTVTARSRRYSPTRDRPWSRVVRDRWRMVPLRARRSTAAAAVTSGDQPRLALGEKPSLAPAVSAGPGGFVRITSHRGALRESVDGEPWAAPV